MTTAVGDPTCRTAARQPVLDPCLTVLIRPGGELQVGWDPERAVLLRPPAGVPPAELARLLELADGTRGRPELMAAAESAGVTGPDFTRLLDELATDGVLGWVPAPRHRSTPDVHVHGQGPLSDALCEGLALSGIHPSRSAGTLDTWCGYPQLVVLADELVLDPCLVSELVSTRVSHLSVRLRDGTAMVGPLVLPGRSSCLRCADLHRAEHDPQWPMIAAQLLGQVGRGSAAAVQATAGLALGQVEQLLDERSTSRGVPRSVNATLEVDPRQGEVRRRVWSPHPRCGCGAYR